MGAAALLISIGCGGSQSTSTTSSQPTTPTTAATFALTGFVREAVSGRNMTGATVTITSGANANHSAATADNGYYAIPALSPGTFAVHVTANGYDASDSSVTLTQNLEVDFTLQAACDTSLWPHVHDPKRLTVKAACITVTGTLMESHSNDDGDIDMDVDVDAPFKYLLNSGNYSSLHGWLHVEAICQSKVHDDVPNAKVSCGTWTGHVPIPANGSYVAVTGVYLLDGDHGWMEIHPITQMTVLK